MIATKGTDFDIILVSGEPYADHPLSPVGMIARVLDAEGYSVGVIDCPDWKKKDDFLKLGRPRLFFGVTSGSIDSMLVNYTPLKRERAVDPNAPFQSRMPDRAVIVYANRIREIHKGARIVLGGIEASLRRFAHYDYWGDDVRRSILLDTRADILVYGPGELQAVEIARRLDRGEGLDAIRGTAIIRAEAPEGALIVPSFEEVRDDKGKFCEAQKRLTNRKTIAQKHANRFVVQYPAPDYTTADLDRVYGLPFSRRIPEGFPELGMARFSVQTHRGCVGRCSFCSLCRSTRATGSFPGPKASILEEIRLMTRHPEWKGFVDDLGGPTANMYGLDRASDRSRPPPAHRPDAGRPQGARRQEGLRPQRHPLRPGRREPRLRPRARPPPRLRPAQDRARARLGKVLRLMNKSGGRRRLEEFRQIFASVVDRKGGRPQHLKYYFMVAHPGTTDTEARELADFLRELERSGEKPVEGVQIFTPTPMTRSTCMYHTGLDPITGEPVYVPRPYAEKKAQKRMLGAEGE